MCNSVQQAFYYVMKHSTVIKRKTTFFVAVSITSCKMQESDLSMVIWMLFWKMDMKYYDIKNSKNSERYAVYIE